MSDDEDRVRERPVEIDKGSRPHSPPVAPSPPPGQDSDSNESSE